MRDGRGRGGAVGARGGRGGEGRVGVQECLPSEGQRSAFGWGGFRVESEGWAPWFGGATVWGRHGLGAPRFGLGFWVTGRGQREGSVRAA